MRIRRATTATLLAALTGLAPAQAARAASLYDFAGQGVIIWSEPTAGSPRVGLGNPGEGFVSDRSEEREPYRCAWFDSVLWHHGRNATTGAAGWVAACDLVDAD
ncbi:hypothetical protein [Nonomuraea helvata]|uniref:SH3 domain-containing protein n=1 Tax=Nonomuraea helvata TaxID=37484 RepID=A0ABV5RQA0_9ACTN